MKVCFFGLGSIGKRHLRNLKIVADEMGIKLEVDAYRSSRRVLDNEVIDLVDRQIYCMEELSSCYDIVFVTNPTALHYNTLRQCKGISKFYFVEKPLFESSSYAIGDIYDEKAKYYIAAPLRFNPVTTFLADEFNDKILSLRVICSSFLPEWREKQDYRDSYSAKKELGGGVSLDLIHEWDYLHYLFGIPQEIKLFKKKCSNLQINSEDLAVYLVRYKDFLAEIHLDYFGRFPQRLIEIFTEEDVIHCDFIRRRIDYLRTGMKYQFDTQADIYVSEMRYFLQNVLSNEKFNNDLFFAYNTLKLTEGLCE